MDETTKPVCDFCSSPKVERQFRAMSFVVHDPFIDGAFREMFNKQGMSESDWAACRVCAKLIDTGQWERVVDRAVSQNVRDLPWQLRKDRRVRETYRTSLRGLYAELRKAMLSDKSEPATVDGTVHSPNEVPLLPTFDEFARQVYEADDDPDKSPSFERWQRQYDPLLRDGYQKVLKSFGVASS